MRGDPWGCAKWPKWAKMANLGEKSNNGKKMIKKMEEFLIPYLKSMPLHFPTTLCREKIKKMPRGDPWECTNVEKAIFPF